jgi:hypothetical protein
MRVSRRTAWNSGGGIPLSAVTQGSKELRGFEGYGAGRNGDVGRKSRSMRSGPVEFGNFTSVLGVLAVLREILLATN